MEESLRLKAKSLGYPEASLSAIQEACSVLKTLDMLGYGITFVNPSEDGGVMIEGRKRGSRVCVELFNDGRFVTLSAEGDGRLIVDGWWINKPTTNKLTQEMDKVLDAWRGSLSLRRSMDEIKSMKS